MDLLTVICVVKTNEIYAVEDINDLIQSFHHAMDLQSLIGAKEKAITHCVSAAAYGVVNWIGLVNLYDYISFYNHVGTLANAKRCIDVHQCLFCIAIWLMQFSSCVGNPRKLAHTQNSGTSHWAHNDWYTTASIMWLIMCVWRDLPIRGSAIYFYLVLLSLSNIK